MLIPYRAKNPPESFPYATYGLMIANTIIFAATSQSFLVVRDSVVADYAISHANFSLLRMFTSLFLHGSLDHLIGNMLFLWIFGQAVEGRLKTGKFLLLYLMAGIAGNLLHDVVDGVLSPKTPSLGASGAIMGLAGAYLYMFPFATICIFYMMRFRAGVVEWQAQWVALYYAGMDLLFGVLLHGMDGVGHFAHIGGFGMGLVGVIALRARRDSEAKSEAQRMRTDVGGDLSILGLGELESLMESPGDNVRLIMAYLRRLISRDVEIHAAAAAATIERHAALLLAQPDASELAMVALSLPPIPGKCVPTALLLRIAGRAESSGDYAQAEALYRRVLQINSTAADAEIALCRLARLTEQIDPNKSHAAALYQEVVTRFPNGTMAMQAQDALLRLKTKGIVPSQTMPPLPTAPVLPAHTPTPKMDPTPSPKPAASDDDDDDDIRPIGFGKEFA